MQALPLKNVAKDSNYVMACCVLHNFCYLHNDDVISDMAENVRLLGRGAEFHETYSDQANKRL